MLDLANTKHAHIDERLRTDPIIWLTTVRPDGRPHIVPVWFLWDGTTILIFSQPNQQKIVNLRHDPRVMLALDNTHGGRDVITIEGTAALFEDGEVNPTLDAYTTKYGTMITQMKMLPATMAATYSQGIRVTPQKFL